MSRLRTELLCMAVAAVAGPAFAQEGQTFRDAESGLSVDLPAPFVLAGRQDRPNYDIAVAVKSSTNAPLAANADGSLCGVAVARAPSNDGLTQAQINAVVAGPGWMARAQGPMALLGKIEQAEIFTQPQPGGGPSVKGGEFIVAPGDGPGHETTRLYLAMWETPKGRLVVTCAGVASQMPAAIDAFRHVRQAVSLGG